MNSIEFLGIAKKSSLFQFAAFAFCSAILTGGTLANGASPVDVGCSGITLVDAQTDAAEGELALVRSLLGEPVPKGKSPFVLGYFDTWHSAVYYCQSPDKAHPKLYRKTTPASREASHLSSEDVDALRDLATTAKGRAKLKVREDFLASQLASLQPRETAKPLANWTRPEGAEKLTFHRRAFCAKWGGTRAGDRRGCGAGPEYRSFNAIPPNVGPPSDDDVAPISGSGDIKA